MISEKVLVNFSQYINYISENIRGLTIKENLTKEEIILENLACLIEEVWEVSAEIRKLTKLSFNKTKVESFNFNDLEEEIVDVLTTIFTLAKSVWVDNLDEAISRKIKKNNDRGY